MSNKEKENASVSGSGSIVRVIDVFYEHLLNPFQNVIKVVSYATQDGNGAKTQEAYTIRRPYGAAYFVRCEISNEVLLFGGLLAYIPDETVELGLIPSLNPENITVTHIDPQTNFAHSVEMPIVALAESDPRGEQTLHRAELVLMLLLVDNCRGRNIFDELPKKVKTLLIETYGQQRGEDMWSNGIKPR